MDCNKTQLKKQPYIQLFSGDWLKSEVAGCGLRQEGFWLRLLIVLHEHEPRGELSIQGKPMPDDMVARRMGISFAEFEENMKELAKVGKPNRRDDGTIYSQRMISLHQTQIAFAKKQSDNGKKGGARSHKKKSDASDNSHIAPTETPF